MPFLGIDIGGTKTIVAVADEKGIIIAQERINTPRERGPDAVLWEIVSAANRLLRNASFSVRDIKAIGVGCGGPLDREKGVILSAPNLSGWENLPIAEYFTNTLSAPTYIENDVNLAALGEARRGHGVGRDPMAYFNMGTGIGGGIIIDGQLYRGCGNAGEFGHQIILPDGPECLCGRRGCLEALASGTSIARRARECLASVPGSAILRYAGVIESVSAEHVALAAQDGDPLALQIWQETGEYVGLGVANVLNILHPRLVVLGGGVVKVGAVLLEHIQRTLSERAMVELVRDVELLPSLLGDQAGIVGAICLAMESVG
ncbi:MAG: ROK family protein [Armatimonadetes bacterium]|nr:ROK family protein [Armatimonadota bacterium]